MSEPTKKGLVPVLRFPVFRDAGEWDKKLLGQVVNKITTGKLDANAMVENGKYRFYTCAKSHYWIDNYAFDTEALLIAGNGAYLGYIHHYKGKFNAYQRTYVLYGFEANVIYLKYFLDRNLPSRIATEKKDGNTPYIVLSTITDSPLHLPGNEEQQKIADCLTSIDELVTAQTQKLEALKAHKKGLMQQLFPAEGETVPKLRFPEFLDVGEWEEKTLGQVAKYENGKAHEQDIAASGDFIVVNSKFISTDGEVKKFTNSAFCIAKKEEILMVLSDIPNGRAIAKCFFVDSDNLYTVNQRICKITPYKAVGIMLFYVLNRNSYFLAFDDGVKQTNLKKDDVLDCPLLLPKDLDEQQKIANCLSSIDELITAQTQKIEALKVHKKGLMQQLFPNTEEER